MRNNDMRKNKVTVFTFPPLSGDPWGIYLGEELREHIECKKLRYTEAYSDWDSFLESLESEVLKTMGDFSFAGDSFGACVALKLALRINSTNHANRLRGIFVSGAFLENPMPATILLPAFEFPFSSSHLTRNLAATAFSYALYSPLLRYSPAPCSRKSIQAYLRDSMDLRGFYSRLRLISLLPRGERAYDMSSSLQEVPGRILIPTQDRLVPLELQQRIVEHFPRFRIEEIANSTHLQRYTHPEEYFRRLREFLAEFQLHTKSGKAA